MEGILNDLSFAVGVFELAGINRALLQSLFHLVLNTESTTLRSKLSVLSLFEETNPNLGES